MAEASVSRVEADIVKFKENMKRIEPCEGEEILFEMAWRYCKDAEYNLKKGDVLTAFGCITYAHGLIDSLKYRQ
ncbi:DUF357 domain-containing protein [Candidatus Micrarchaeota archaeon]|nr:MAG: DUF357 domain-containing protein [Candidatus Micrarchaeota archaeon]